MNRTLIHSVRSFCSAGIEGYFRLLDRCPWSNDLWAWQGNAPGMWLSFAAPPVFLCLMFPMRSLWFLLRLPAVPSWAAPIIGQGLWETQPLYPAYYGLKILFHYPSTHHCLCRTSFRYYEPFKWYELQTALKVHLFIALGNFKVLLSNVFSDPCNSVLLNLVVFISSLLIVVVQPYLCWSNQG